MIQMALVLAFLVPLFSAPGQRVRADPPPARQEWIPLFNGKDLTGWFARGKAKWEVVDGVLTGSGDAGHLYAEPVLTDLEFRGMFRVSDKGNSGVYFRANPPADDPNRFPQGYEAQIDNHSNSHTGWLWKPRTPTGPAKKLITRDNEWFSLGIRAVGDHIQIWINDQLMTDHWDSTYTRGHFAIQCHNPGMKIEAKDLYYRPVVADQSRSPRAAGRTQLSADTVPLPFEGDPRLTVLRDVVYGRSHPEIQKLDAYLVKSERPTPVLIEVHGGGWRRGRKSDFRAYRGGLMDKIIASGISLVSIDYRLTPDHVFPAQMHDLARAVQFVRFKAKEWNLRHDRIAATGGSAGAHLSAWVALHDDLARPDSDDPVERLSTRLTAFVAFWGPMDLTRVRVKELAQQGSRGEDFANAFTAPFGSTREEFDESEEVRRKIRDASPLFLVSRDDPPGLVFAAAPQKMCAGEHPPVPDTINDPHSAWHSVLLADAMRDAGIEVECWIGPHVAKDHTAGADTVVKFLRRHLLRD